MFDRFTDHAKQTMNLARQEAQRLHHEYLGTEHILLGLIRVGDCAATNLLRRRGVDLDRVRLEVEKLALTGPSAPEGQLPFTPRAKKVLEYSMEEASNLAHRHLGTEHLLLGLIKEGEGIAWRVLSVFDVRLEDVREDLRGDYLAKASEEERGKPVGDAPVQTSTAGHRESSAASYLGNDLTAFAERGALEPMIGREAELERLIQVLCRKVHPNAVVIGRAGTGKTALVHGLACAIAAGRVPDELRKKRLIELNLGQAVVGSVEERWRKVADEAKRRGDVVFVMDDLTVLLPSGANRRGDRVDAEGMLRFALTGSTACIAVATPVLWTELVEPHEALARRLQPVHLPAATRAETHAILRGVQERYERHHQVHWTAEALDAALDLTSAQLPDVPLPGIAIDVLDDASVTVKFANRPAASDPAVLALGIEALERAKRRALEAQELQRAAHLHEEANQQRARMTASQDRANRPESWGTVTAEHVAHAVAARVAR